MECYWKDVTCTCDRRRLAERATVLILAVILARGGTDPIAAIVFLFALLIFAAVRSLFRDRPAQSSKAAHLPSFPFCEIREDSSSPTPVRTIHTKIRGVSFSNPNGASRQEIIRQFCRVGDALLLMREPANPVDSNAVAVIRICRGTDGKTEFGDLLGHLSREIARDLALHFDQGPVGFAEILEITGDLEHRDCGNVGVNIRADIYMSGCDTNRRPRRSTARRRASIGSPRNS